MYIERGKGPGPLVFRGRDREESVEDIPRDFPPPRGQDYRRSRDYDEYSARTSRPARSARGSRYDDDYYDDDRYTDYGPPAAAAGRHRSRSRRRRDDYSDYSSSPPRSERKERRKSGVGDLLGGLGLGGLAGGILGKDGKSRSGSRGARSRSRGARSRRYSSSRSRSRSRGKNEKERKWAQAAQAALVAGAVEAFRARNEAGPWTGDKGKRIATAALGAGGIDGLIDRDPGKKTKRHLAEAVIGGVAASRLANGPISKSRSRGRDRAISPDARPRSRSRSVLDRGRSRSKSIIDRFRGRSKSRAGSDAGTEREGGGIGGAVKGVAAGGALAAAGKAIYDRVRSKSRRRRSPSSSSADSYVPSRNRRRDMRRSPRSDTDGRSTPRSQAGAAGVRGRARGPASNGVGPVAAGAGGGAGAGALVGSHDRAPSSDSSSTTDMENKRKHMRGKELLTAGLATIATIHAAHGVYSSMEAHEKRHRLVAEGEMSPEEARKKQTKAWVQDAAAVGIAALGIKGAFSEWKEMNEQRCVFPMPMHCLWSSLPVGVLGVYADNHSFHGRREVHEIEKRKRERVKKRRLQKEQEEKDRQERMLQIMSQNPMLAYGLQNGQMPFNYPQRGGGAPMPQMQMPMRAGPPPADQSGNPYAPRDR